MLFSRLFLARQAVGQLQVCNSPIHLSACHKSMDLKKVVKTLESLAPTSLAESWDNVGLLIEPSSQKNVKVLLGAFDGCSGVVKCGCVLNSCHNFCLFDQIMRFNFQVVFLTNDLTEPVLDEAVKASTDLIISYHPPLFRPFKRLTSKSWKERITVKCIEERIALFSPHTSWDAVPGGINTWLLAPFGPGHSAPVSPASSKAWPGGVSHSVSVQGVPIHTDQLSPLLALPDISLSLDSTALSVGCSKVTSCICS